MKEDNLQRYPYRWMVLFVFMLLMAMQQLLWITFAPITSIAASFYHVSDLSIGLLSVIFMIVYIIVSLPASWLIDKYGFRFAVGLGAILTGVFGLLRGIFAADYLLVLIFQIGIALGQPLVINAVTTVSVRWFPLEQRATASGLAWLAGYLGLIAGLALTPYLVMSNSISSVLLWYGVISIIAAIAFICFAKEHPPTPQCQPEQIEKSLVFNGLRLLLKKKNFILLMIVFFVGLGLFNGLSTWIEDIIRPRGFTPDQAGLIGGMMVASGVVGSGIVPLLSDKFHNRSRFVLIAIAGSIPGLIGIAFATSFGLLLASACTLGFFMLSTAPIGFQYGTEIAYPAPGGTATGMLMMMGQISGIAFIFGMNVFKSPVTGSMAPAMLILIVLMFITVFVCTRLREVPLKD